jgi:hypothetical protein
LRIWVNNLPIDLIPGMTVRHALLQADLFFKIEKGAKVFDEWGNEVGTDGALEEGSRLYVRSA